MKDALLKLVDEGIQAPYGQALKQLVRPYIRIRTEKAEPGGPPGTSRIGGCPDMPKGMAWPRSEDGKAAMQFVGQFDLSELAALDEENLLPKDGILQFFLHEDEGKVYHHRVKADSLGPVPPPPQEEPRPTFWSKLFKPKPRKLLFDPCSLRLTKEYSIPSWDSIYVDMIALEQAPKVKPGEAYSEDFLEGDCGLRDSGDNRTNHHFLGYTDGIQNSYKEIDAEEPPDLDWKMISLAQYRKFAEWILLLQIDTDGNADMMWGDAGRVYFMIRRADLAKGDFSRVKLTMDCY